MVKFKDLKLKEKVKKAMKFRYVALVLLFIMAGMGLIDYDKCIYAYKHLS